VEVGHIGAALGGRLKAGGLETLHLFGDAHIGKCGGAGLGPDGIAVSVVAVVMRVKDVLDGFGRNSLRRFHGQARSAGEVRIHYDQVVFHLDDDVVGVAEVGKVALAEPDTGDDELDFSRLSGRASRKKRHRNEDGEAG